MVTRRLNCPIMAAAVEAFMGYFGFLSAATLSAALLVGCAPSPPAGLVAPSGEIMRAGQGVMSAKCSRSPSGCFKQATDACGGGSYQVHSSESHSGGLLADMMPGPVTWYSMTFQCGASDGRMPAFPYRATQVIPVPVASPRPSPTRTTCNRMGPTVNCTSY